MTKQDLIELLEDVPDNMDIFMLLPGKGKLFNFLPVSVDESGVYEFGTSENGSALPGEGFVLISEDEEEKEEEKETEEEDDHRGLFY